jgi:hypothetical protein
MLLMLALNVLEEDQERLRLLGRQISLSQVSDEGTLLRNVPVADFDVPPNHTEFGFAFAHRHIVAGRTRLVSVCFPPVADPSLPRADSAAGTHGFAPLSLILSPVRAAPRPSNG